MPMPRVTPQSEFGGQSDFGFDVGQEFLEGSELGRRSSFFSFVNQQQSPQRRFFQNQFQNIQNQFLGQLGQTIRQGGQPDQTFQSFLEGFPFSQRFQELPPALRGQLNNRFAPSVRFFF